MRIILRLTVIPTVALFFIAASTLAQDSNSTIGMEKKGDDPDQPLYKLNIGAIPALSHYFRFDTLSSAKASVADITTAYDNPAQLLELSRQGSCGRFLSQRLCIGDSINFGQFHAQVMAVTRKTFSESIFSGMPSPQQLQLILLKDSETGKYILAPADMIIALKKFDENPQLVQLSSSGNCAKEVLFISWDSKNRECALSKAKRLLNDTCKIAGLSLDVGTLKTTYEYLGWNDAGITPTAFANTKANCSPQTNNLPGGAPQAVL